MLDGLIFCCCWYVLKETSLSVCQVMKTPWELMDTNCREALELWTALVYYWQLNAHTHIQPVGPPVSRGVTFLFGCAAMRVQRLSWSSLHTAEDAHMMKDPKVPLVFVTTLLPLIPSVLWWPDQSCLSHAVWSVLFCQEQAESKVQNSPTFWIFECVIFMYSHYRESP